MTKERVKLIFRLFIPVFILILFRPSFSPAAEIKNVIILDFADRDDNPNNRYLVSSITDAVKSSLQKMFIFNSTMRGTWEEVARDNYLFKEDLHTRSVALNLGLLAKQDIVISGSFRIIPGGKEGKGTSTIETTVRIIDVPKKRFIADFKMTNRADSTIFDSIDKIARRITEEARSVLPSKEEWKRRGIRTRRKLVVFSQPLIGVRVGACGYMFGFADEISARQPSFSAFVRSRVPVIWSRLSVQFQFDYYTHKLTPTKGSELYGKAITGETLNYITTLFFGTDFILNRDFSLFPKFGAGYQFQNTTITGELNDSFGNSFPVMGPGLDLSYRMSSSLDLVLTLQSLAQIENSTITTINQASLGINLRF